MKLNRQLIAGLYALCLLLVVVPPIETLVGSLPIRLGSPPWRYGVAGILSQALLTAFLGLALMAVLAFVLEHGRTLRAIGVCFGVVAVGLVLAGGVYVLDAVETRTQVRPEGMTRFYLATALAFSKMSAGVVVGALLSRGCWKARPAKRGREPSFPLAM